MSNETYRMAMNRDETITRGAGLPLEISEFDHGRAIYPGDGSGGTWFATNESGVTLALLNWNDVSAVRIALVKTRSRGRVIPALIGSQSLSDLHELVAFSNFEGMLPFRLVGVFPSQWEICEWRWESTRLEFQVHQWESRHWFSSSLSDEHAETLRGTACRNAEHEPDAGSVVWLRRLHSSHAEGPGPFSLCVHRGDVKTLSYSEVSVSSSHIEMKHFRGSPCTMGPIQSMAIDRTRARKQMFEKLGTSVI
ncbi:MAG TPA: NRDE family protein [Candidatus Acidoferrum sp.]|nr:NRDE family protein [Candidatus Acidoferrum sp.]